MRTAMSTWVLVLILATTAVVAGPREEGLAAGKRGDYATAVRLLRPLAEQGDALAQYNLGFMYANGRGVPQDYGQAGQWYRKAAEQGDVLAQSSLGLMYVSGLGVPQDFVQAHMWLNLAAAAGNPDAIKYRNMFAAEMTPAQIAEAQKLAQAWKPKKAEAN